MAGSPSVAALPTWRGRSGIATSTFIFSASSTCAPLQAAGHADAGSAPPRRAGPAPAPSAGRAAAACRGSLASVGSITSTRWCDQIEQVAVQRHRRERHVGDDEIVAAAQRRQQRCGGARRAWLGVRAIFSSPASTCSRSAAGWAARSASSASMRSGIPAPSAGPARAGCSAGTRPSPRCRSGSSSTVWRRSSTPKCHARLTAIVVAPTPPRTPVTRDHAPAHADLAARRLATHERRRNGATPVARDRLGQVFRRPQPAGDLAIERRRCRPRRPPARKRPARPRSTSRRVRQRLHPRR